MKIKNSHEFTRILTNYKNKILVQLVEKFSSNRKAVLKVGLWFKVKAGASFPAGRDFPTIRFIFVGRNPQAYSSISRI